MATRRKGSRDSSTSNGQSLRVVRPPNGSPVPTNAELGQLGRWWRGYKNQPLDEIPEATTLATALADVQILALGYLARRLTDEKTPDTVRDRIALALGPKIQVQLHRGLGEPSRVDEGAGLLADYRPSRPDA